jgi:hypothetical protein
MSDFDCSITSSDGVPRVLIISWSWDRTSLPEIEQEIITDTFPTKREVRGCHSSKTD